MVNDLDTVEEALNKKAQPKKKVKQSGRSVFRLQEIIKRKGKIKDGDSRESVAGDDPRDAEKS